MPAPLKSRAVRSYRVHWKGVPRCCLYNLRHSMQAREITPYVGEILVCHECGSLLQLRKSGNWGLISKEHPIEGGDDNLYCEVCSSNVCQHCDRARRTLQGTFLLGHPEESDPEAGHWDGRGWDGVDFVD